MLVPRRKLGLNPSSPRPHDTKTQFPHPESVKRQEEERPLGAGAQAEPQIQFLAQQGPRHHRAWPQRKKDFASQDMFEAPAEQLAYRFDPLNYVHPGLPLSSCATPTPDMQVQICSLGLTVNRNPGYKSLAAHSMDENKAHWETWQHSHRVLTPSSGPTVQGQCTKTLGTSGLQQPQTPNTLALCRALC